ncbi:hypothetical protein ASPBRDRAFT_201081 [Aspergillus brasiliensis CBS 101740]|uniref:Uncharacterized protein n=1 Tax=Aspergillus brasiliensis (strain CBS 101740 / IMI 381727 / IBT 21946) TaxID=767769 RepID=A0A1L9U467_ASPBC|nr:hypothetical protein ASPBRDRAFT_201081 [Aspergillus brasiliensis CBS 101740]
MPTNVLWKSTLFNGFLLPTVEWNVHVVDPTEWNTPPQDPYFDGSSRTLAATSATSLAGIGDVRLRPNAKRIVPELSMDRAANPRKGDSPETSSDPMLGGVGDIHEVHIRNGHLRHVDEQLNSSAGSRYRGHHRRSFEILGRHTHAEKKYVYIPEKPENLFRYRQIGDHNFCSEFSKARNSSNITADQRTDWHTGGSQSCHNTATYSSNLAGSSSNQHWRHSIWHNDRSTVKKK